MSPPRCSAYVKGNNARYGLKVASRDASTGTVIGLQCRFCIAFGCEEKVGSKRKPTSTVQGWNAPFRYDNIEKHIRFVYPSQWDVYNAIKTADGRDSFLLMGVLLENKRVPSSLTSYLKLWALSDKQCLILKKQSWERLWVR